MISDTSSLEVAKTKRKRNNKGVHVRFEPAGHTWTTISKYQNGKRRHHEQSRTNTMLRLAPLPVKRDNVRAKQRTSTFGEYDTNWPEIGIRVQQTSCTMSSEGKRDYA